MSNIRIKRFSELLNEGWSLHDGELRRSMCEPITSEMQKFLGRTVVMIPVYSGFYDHDYHKYKIAGTDWIWDVTALDLRANIFGCAHDYINISFYHEQSPLARFACKYCDKDK